MSRWRREEVKFLLDNFDRMSLKDLARELGRSYESVKAKSRSLGLKKMQYRKWTKEEIEFLRENADKMTIKEMAQRLGRSYEITVRTFRYLNLRGKGQRRWTPEEERILREEFSKGTPLKEIAEKLDRSYDSIKGKISSLNLKRRERHRRWTQEEISYLIANKDKPIDELSSELGRTPTAVFSKLHQLGVLRKGRLHKRWTREEEEFLLKNHDKMTLEELASRLGRTKDSIKGKMRFLRLGRPPGLGEIRRTRKIWTEDEKEFLKRNSKNFTAKELSELLGRTESSVRNMLRVLGLKPKKGRIGKRGADEDEELIRKILNHELPRSEVRKKIFRSKGLAREILKRLGFW